MDIPNRDSRTSPSNSENIPRIRNLHPSHLSPDLNDSYHTVHSPHYGATPLDNGVLPGRLSGSSLSERIGSFVGSYSRTSLMFMAENLAVPATSPPSAGFHHVRLHDDEEDKLSTSSIGSMSRRPSGEYHYQRRSSSFHSQLEQNERTSLFMTGLDRVMSTQTIATVADDYRQFATPISSIHHHSYHDANSTATPAIYEDHHKSSFAQSIFNSINILLGVGILALPLGFKIAGWVAGISIFAFCCLLTNYTAKLLGRCLEADPESRTFGDLAGAAFGMRGRVLVTALFVTELVTNSVAMVILLGDGLNSLFPGFDIVSLRIASFLILTPMLFFPVRYLSYSSLLGIISAVSIILVMLYDGFTKVTSPGSLIEPADTSILPNDYMKLPLSFGLIMAGFASHAVFPTVYRDMDNPKQFDTMVNCTYSVTTIIYFGVAACGYLMFGSQTMQEITQNLMMVPEYNQALNRLAVWLMALQPFAKYGLNLSPVNLAFEIAVFRHTWVSNWMAKSSWREPMLTLISRTTISIMIVALAYFIPGFENVMGLIGSFFSYAISGILPLMCYLKLFGDTISPVGKAWHYVLIFISSCLAFFGTLWSFI
ncbi:transmembrane amino acid transporter protein-domain-containing protein [Zychaea mexicana]|uniref:transmembrane amino acid transporter protein-domain-containing protein n=1 Tax=Zychaea mexicana TaxID=64656 RepID=UPI0022FE90FB|nr:transmembrane amino acid transporter protein-domain-containing protein [Zychaea mexicana]KAI9498695.1 transmembrane amino acid transporter protein-domain-containing protein [Zychaea mexicana]